MNRDILATLTQWHADGKLGHAYVFAGPKGIGKFETARALAQRVNCLKDAMDPLTCDCGSCRKIAGGNHPDIFVLEKPEDKTGIGIDQIRLLIERFEFRALEARVKFAIVKSAELIHEGAANAFLKTLEEPRQDTVLILTTALPDALLSTIRSRCQWMHFPGMPEKELVGLLQKEHGLSAHDAVVLAAFGQGSPGRALDLGEAFLARRSRLLDAFFSPGDAEGLIKVVGPQREDGDLALGVILMVLRDAMMLHCGTPESVVNRDRQVEIKRLAQRYTPRELSAHAALVQDALRRIDGHQNMKVVLTVVREMLVS
ncbi:MAG: DNA polymerase III subunit delta' [Candidatus Omnitrophota bacterium]